MDMTHDILYVGMTNSDFDIEGKINATMVGKTTRTVINS